MELTDRHVVVTGGSRGIGPAIGACFAAAGAKVTLVARSKADLAAAAAASAGAGYVVADLLDLPALGGLVEQLEAMAPIDILVNNAGLGTPGPLDEMTAEALRDLYTLNALVPAELARLVIPTMRAQEIGRLVFISSLSAQVAMPGLTAYSATKAALSQLAEGLRQELKGTGVGVTSVEIGPVETGLYDEVTAYQPCADAFNRAIKLGVLTMLSPAAVASAVVKACRHDRPQVVLPKRAAMQAAVSHLPQRLANRML